MRKSFMCTCFSKFYPLNLLKMKGSVPKIFKIVFIILGATVLVIGCSKQTQITDRELPLVNEERQIQVADEKQLQTNEEKIQRIIEVQTNESINQKETVNLYGFEIPCYLINIDDLPLVNYQETPYPYMKLSSLRNPLMVLLDVKYPENGGDTYRLSNLLSLKFDKEIVADLMKKFKAEEFSTEEYQIIDFEDGTYIMFEIATDDTRVVTIGNIEDKPDNVKKTP